MLVVLIYNILKLNYTVHFIYHVIKFMSIEQLRSNLGKLCERHATDFKELDSIHVEYPGSKKLVWANTDKDHIKVITKYLQRKGNC